MPHFYQCPLPGIRQGFGEEDEHGAVVSVDLRAVALHQHAQDSANQDTIDRLGRGAEQIAVDFQEFCGIKHKQ